MFGGTGFVLVFTLSALESLLALSKQNICVIKNDILIPVILTFSYIQIVQPPDGPMHQLFVIGDKLPCIFFPIVKA